MIQTCEFRPRGKTVSNLKLLKTKSTICSLFQTLREPSENRKDVKALTLVRPRRNNPALDPLAVLHLDNGLYTKPSSSIVFQRASNSTPLGLLPSSRCLIIPRKFDYNRIFRREQQNNKICGRI